MTASLLAFLGVSALVIVTPGPDTAVTVSSTAGGGRRGGVFTALGVSCGQAVWTLTASAGISAVLVACRPAFLTLKYLGAAYLLYLVYRHFSGGESAENRRKPPPAKPWLGLTAFWATVVRVEITDIVFAIDSILVAVAMSPKIWVILTGGILGIIMMRLVIGRLLVLVERYPPLVDGAFVIIAWVSAKLLVEYLHAEGYIGFEIPKWLSLGLIVVIFAIALGYSIASEKKEVPR